jgi:type I restriction enzyme, S subunit
VSELPNGWTRLSLGDAGRWVGGGTPSKDVRRFWSSGTVPWVSPKDMKQARVRDSEDHITSEALSASAARLVPASSVLVVVRSGILEHSLPVAVTDADVTVNQDLKALTPHKGVNADFIAWALRSSSQEILHSCKKDGTTVASIDFARLKAFEIPLAPVQEQPRIVDAIESYVSRLDDAVESLQRAQARLKAYRASVLKAAAEGRLVTTEAEVARKEKRDYEPADVLLKRILAERGRRWEEAELARLNAAGKSPKDDRWKARYDEPGAADASTLPTLPEGWCWASLDQLALLVRNGQSLAPRESAGVRTLRISAVRPLAVDFSDVRFLPGTAADYADDLIETDDLLFTRYNGTPSLVGVCARVGAVNEPTVHPDKLIKVRLAPAIHSRYAAIASNAGASRRHVEMRRRTTAGQSGISGGDLKVMPIPLPPPLEQQRIADRTETLLSIADDTEKALAKEVLRCARLRQAVMNWAFAGKLVDQNPADELADRLLARIRAERKPATPSTAPRRLRVKPKR